MICVSLLSRKSNGSGTVNTAQKNAEFPASPLPTCCRGDDETHRAFFSRTLPTCQPSVSLSAFSSQLKFETGRQHWRTWLAVRLDLGEKQTNQDTVRKFHSCRNCTPHSVTYIILFYYIVFVFITIVEFTRELTRHFMQSAAASQGYLARKTQITPQWVMCNYHPVCDA